MIRAMDPTGRIHEIEVKGMDVTGDQPKSEEYREWPAMYGGAAAAEEARITKPTTNPFAWSRGPEERPKTCEVLVTAQWCSKHRMRVDIEHAPGTTVVAITDSLCPIGRIEEATEAAIARIKEASHR